MKYLWYLSIVFLLLALLAACDKDDPEPTPQPPSTTYNVNYSISIFGGYNNLQMWYFMPGNLKEFKSNPKLPMEMHYNNFNILDSVAVHAAVLPMPNRQLIIHYSVDITKDTSYSNFYNFSDTIVTGPNTDTLYFDYFTRID